MGPMTIAREEVVLLVLVLVAAGLLAYGVASLKPGWIAWWTISYE